MIYIPTYITDDSVPRSLSSKKEKKRKREKKNFVVILSLGVN